MNPNLVGRLDRLVDRHAELSMLLSEAETMANQARFVAYSREYAELSPIVELMGKWRQVTAELSDIQSWLTGGDPELRELAEAEKPSVQEAKQRLEAELTVALIPKDPADSRDAYLEIRAGTGGDEAGLFCGDLLRMYLKFAERKGWRAEVVSESAAELGGLIRAPKSVNSLIELIYSYHHR